MRAHPSMAVLGLAIAILWAGSAAGQASDGVIHACVNNDSGDMKIVAASAECPRNSRRLSWNVSGPAGPQGPAGPPATLASAAPAAGAWVGTLYNVRQPTFNEPHPHPLFAMNDPNGAPMGVTNNFPMPWTITVRCDGEFVCRTDMQSVVVSANTLFLFAVPAGEAVSGITLSIATQGSTMDGTVMGPEGEMGTLRGIAVGEEMALVRLSMNLRCGTVRFAGVAAVRADGTGLSLTASGGGPGCSRQFISAGFRRP